ncbi:MAG: FHA domain-containing protein [Pseudomonadales bacterium]|nr:FHA domain-containing protein [Pseudomonadales bacterium]
MHVDKLAMYKIQEKGRPETAVWLINAMTIISNDDTADIPFYGSSTGTTKVHILLQDSEIYLQDVSLNTPISHNNHRVNHRVQIHHGDVIKIGNTSYQILNGQANQASMVSATSYQPIAKDPKHWQLQAIDGEIKGRSFKLGTQTVIGRDADSNICIPNEQLSRRHVQLIVTGGKVLLQDLNSTNGTFINGKRVEHRILDENDELRVGRITFKLVPPKLEPSNNSNEQKTMITAAVPKVQVKLANNPQANLSTTQKSWVTKPTSVGNREDDSIDIILAKHMRTKKLALSLFVASIAGLSGLAYWLFA